MKKTNKPTEMQKNPSEKNLKPPKKIQTKTKLRNLEADGLMICILTAK